MRLYIADEFGYWFSGFFDGEGCLVVHFQKSEVRNRRQLAIQIALRKDDEPVLSLIVNQLHVGSIGDRPEMGNGHESSMFRLSNVKDLAEIILPLFDKYPLRSKKSKELIIWRRIVIAQYIATLGGTTKRTNATWQGDEEFRRRVLEIRKIRHPYN